MAGKRRAPGRLEAFKSTFLGRERHDSDKISRAINWNNTDSEGRRAMEHPMFPPGQHRRRAFNQATESATNVI